MDEKLLTGYEAIIPGGGTMGKLIRSYDWSQTSVGAIENWSSSLKTAVSIMLSSRFPMFIWWGQDESINFYNDAYIPILGARHPHALGQPAFQVWAEVWDTLSPQIEGVLKEGKAYWNEDYHVILYRNGYQEETYFTFSYSPIFSETGDIAGIFCAITEETRRVLNDRRIKTLRELAAETVKAKTVEDAGEMAIATLEHNPQDLPFALLYLLNETESLARLIATTKSIEGMSVCPVEVELENGDDLWSLEQVLRSGESQVIQLNESKYGSLPGGAWSESPKLAVVLPIANLGQTVKGWLIAGVSPVRELDNDYQGFFDLISGQIATAIANARAYEAEKQRAEALAEIDRAKTTFFSNVSHEFRTPLTLMLSPLEDALFDIQEPLPPLQRQRIEVIQRNAMRLLKLVNTLLDFSRIEAGRIQAVYQPTDLATLTAELASVFRSAIEQASMELIVDCPSLPEAIYVDRDLWEKIVLNLISNAFKFTFSGSIAVRLRWHESQVELSVADTGIGIPPAELSRLFERFYRVEGSRGRSIEGSGIGLSLVKELVELHDGTITVTSTEGSGSCFTVAIPTGSAHLPSDRLSHDSDEMISSASIHSLYHQEISSLLKNIPPQKTPLQIANNETTSPKVINSTNSTVRILVADDNADMRDYLERLLTSSYTVEIVADGITALNTARNNPPDLVLSDVMMPGMDGFELLRSLRANPETQEIPVILLSARAGEESRIEGLEAGADDYLIKPFSTRELLARIEATLKLAQLRKTAQTLRQQTETAKANLQNVLTSLRDGFYTLDRDWHFTYVNDRQLEIVARSREEMIGKCIWDLYPDLVDSDFYHQVHRAMAERISFKFDYHYPAFDRWYEHRVYPLPDGLAILCAEITERKQIEREREQLLARETSARSKAEELNRLKDEFLAIVSHELRTPLNPILGWSQLLSAGRLNPKQTAKGIAIVERNAKLQAQLIEDLLDVSRILRDKIELNKIPVDLKQVIKAAIATVQLNAEAKSIPITTKFEPKVGLVSGDSGRLQQIVWNLLSNAIKFTPEGGQVTVKLSSNGKSAIIQVRDTGQGIEPEFLPYIFDRFRQADSANTRNFGGLGLGLAIAQHLTKLHDGAIAVTSPGKDRGTTFTVELPLASIDTEMSSASHSLDNVVQPKKLTGIRVLAVDDELDSLSLLAFILEQEGAKVTTATSATEALKILLESTFDLLISDIGMPEVNGYELIRKIRSMPSPIAAIKAIALTAYAGESDIQQARKAGFQQHIAKPLDVNTSIAVSIELLTSEAKGFDL